MSFLLTLLGAVMLVASVACCAFGVFMATNSRTREAGKYFALWWIPGGAMSVGVIMKDVVTVFVGFVCFAVAGCIYLFEARKVRAASKSQSSARRSRRNSEGTTSENPKRGYSRRRAS